MEPSRVRNIVYVEDDPNDVAIFTMAFKRATLPHVLRVAEDGQQAIDWLSGEGQHQNREQFPVPDVLILDLKMPRKSGFDVLEWLQQKPEYNKLLRIVLSSSDDPNDVKKAYELGATTYFAKTYSYHDVIEYLRLLS